MHTGGGYAHQSDLGDIGVPTHDARTGHGLQSGLGPLHPLLVVRRAAHTGSALGSHSDWVILAGHCSEAPQTQGSEEEAEGSLVLPSGELGGHVCGQCQFFITQWKATGI